MEGIEVMVEGEGLSDGSIVYNVALFDPEYHGGPIPAVKGDKVTLTCPSRDDAVELAGAIGRLTLNTEPWDERVRAA